MEIHKPRKQKIFIQKIRQIENAIANQNLARCLVPWVFLYGRENSDHTQKNQKQNIVHTLISFLIELLYEKESTFK